MSNSQNIDVLRMRCAKQARDTYATSKMFLQRSNFYRRFLIAIEAVAVLVPLILGVLAMQYGPDILTGNVLTIAGTLLAGQAIFGALALILKWRDKYTYALESGSENAVLSQEFEDLGAAPPPTHNEFHARYRELQQRNQTRETRDVQQGLSESEIRRGHRKMLLDKNAKCGSCEKVPVSMSPSSCDACGNFGMKRFTRRNRKEVNSESQDIQSSPRVHGTGLGREAVDPRSDPRLRELDGNAEEEQT